MNLEENGEGYIEEKKKNVVLIISQFLNVKKEIHLFSRSFSSFYEKLNLRIIISLKFLMYHIKSFMIDHT